MIRRLYERWILNPKALAIARSIRDEPSKWEPSAANTINGKRHCLCCGRLEIWMGNGWWFVEIHSPCEEKLGLVGRTIVWRRARRIMRAADNGKYEANEAAIREITGADQ